MDQPTQRQLEYIRDLENELRECLGSLAASDVSFTELTGRARQLKMMKWSKENRWALNIFERSLELVKVVAVSVFGEYDYPATRKPAARKAMAKFLIMNWKSPEPKTKSDASAVIDNLKSANYLMDMVR